jgi:hypothetical protein
MEAVLDFISAQPPLQRRIMQVLHELVAPNPGVTGKIRYQLPFYYRHSWVCYLNPTKDGGVEFAFPRGNELLDAPGLLEARGRKQVRSVTFFQLRELPMEALHELVQEALLLDESRPYAAKRTSKGKKPQ